MRISYHWDGGTTPPPKLMISKIFHVCIWWISPTQIILTSAVIFPYHHSPVDGSAPLVRRMPPSGRSSPQTTQKRPPKKGKSRIKKTHCASLNGR